eukprot:XP_025013042.1 disease resistance protein TAO1-like isoform X2 [Ricinus communis]
MCYCINLKRIPNSICNLIALTCLNLIGSAIKQIPSSIEHLSQLIALNLTDCKYLESLPSSIGGLPRLATMYLNSCESLRSLPELPLSLRMLFANNCKSLESESITSNRHLLVTFANCLRLRFDQTALQMTDFLVPTNVPGRFYWLYPGSEVPGWFSNQSRVCRGPC